jgi:DNA topoisomerase-3
MAEKGLGTPATRAAIIEGLIAEEYMHRQGKELVPTAKAFSLMVLLDGLGVQELTKPELTGDWEFRLRQVHRRQLPRQEFMNEIREFTERIVSKAKAYEHDTIPGDFGRLAEPCPKCGGEVHETYKKFQCQNEQCDFALWKIISGRQFEPEEAEQLIHKKEVGPLRGFRSRLGKPFDALLRLSAEYKVEFDFGNGASASGNGGAAAEVDFTGKDPVGQCPKCQSRVFENGMNYVCEKSVGAAKACDFRTGTMILQQPVDKTQVAKLLREGKTDLLKGFVSRRNGRKFEAFLALKDGEVKFEFVPRERKGTAKERKNAPPAEKVDFTGQPPLGKCPKCGSRIFQGPDHYLCERSQAEAKRCTFKLDKVKNGQPISVEQLQKLLTTGRTDLLEKFISRLGRPFSAFLVIEGKSKVAFEFPPRDGEAGPTNSDKAA